MPDRHAVIWSHCTDGPTKMGNLIATGTETRFSYTDDFLNQDAISGLSLLTSPALYGNNPVIHQASEILPLHPRLMALIPGRASNNIQRRAYAEMLAKNNPPPPPGFDTEWELLMLTGRNGIGHIDVFQDDLEAERWYSQKQKAASAIGKRSVFWEFVRQDIQVTAALEDIDIVSLIGPTPSVGGMIPKILVSIPDCEKWDGSIAEPGTKSVDLQKYTDVILKIEYPEYAGLATLEALALDMHTEMGFEVPRHWCTHIDGMNLIAIERFDRNEEGCPIPMESFFSVMASGTSDIQSSTGTEMERIGTMLNTMPRIANINATEAQLEVYRRFITAIFTGNGDLHLENLAFLGGNQQTRISPIYDPAPMRAWPRHNLLSAIPFVIEDSLYPSLITLGESFSISKNDATDIIQDIRGKTRSFIGLVSEQEKIPEATRQHLIDVIKGVRKKIH
jgi:serine/threonine-protein kinase HipA